MNHVQKIVAFPITRFGLAGMANTAVSFAILNLVFYGLHQGKLASVVIATSCAIALSFMLNRSFVFLDKERATKKLGRFILVSVAGVFLIQNAVYAVCIAFLHGHESGAITAIHRLATIRLSSEFVDINLSNLLASFAVMFWNYNGYRIFVFNGERHGNRIIEDSVTETI
jgi:putative flippase GtrA